MLLCGCGSSDSAYVPTGDGLTWDEDYTGPVATAPKQEEETPLVLTYYPNVTMNPFQCTDFTNRALFSLIYQSLFVTDRSYQVKPILCKNYKVSEDMMTYTFYLDAATFSDGTPITPNDALASLEAARQSQYYSGRFFYVNTIALSEDGGITISLWTPYENLPLLLDIPIIKEAELEKAYPLGTGPYVFNENAAVLQRRSNWWCRSDLPITQDSIRLIQAKSLTHIRDSFEFGDLSLVCANPASDRYVDYRCDYELWDCDNGMFMYLACNMDSNIFGNETVRAGLTHAIDRDSITKEFYRGFARGTTLPASPLFPYYNQGLAARYEYEPLKFTQLVQDAGLREAKVVLLVNEDDSLRLRVARKIAQMLEDCSLNVELRTASGADYLYYLNAREYDLYLGQTKLSPNMDLTPFFYSNGALSYGGIDDPVLYQLCQQTLENHGNYYTLHKTVMDQGRVCPILVGSYGVFATRGMLTNLSPSRDNIFCYGIGKTVESVLMS